MILNSYLESFSNVPNNILIFKILPLKLLNYIINFVEFVEISINL